MNKLSVAVLMGGDSSERSVSFSSGRAVAQALSKDKYAVTCFDVSSLGDRGEISRADAMGRRPGQAIFPVNWSHLVATLATHGFDCALPVLHGGRGEDGTLQSLLEVAGIPYCGPGPRACAIAADKPLAKAFGKSLGVPSPAGQFVGGIEEVKTAQVPYPCVVKPAGGGSSVGVTIVHEAARLPAALAAALADGSGALIEEFITGIETTCAVLGEGPAAQALPVIEILPVKGGGFYDFEAKYLTGGSEHLVPPRSVDEKAQRRIQELTLTLHRALGCKGVTRSDFIVDEKGEPYYLETNCLPGMTETSLVPDAARAAGISFSDLIERLIEGALGPARTRNA